MDVQSNLTFESRLPRPRDLKEEMPISEKALLAKDKIDNELQAIFNWESNKKVVIVGPCSADSKEPVLDYCKLLRDVQDSLRNLVLVPRVYTQKPRTNGTGYMGLLHGESPDGKEDNFDGIRAVRDLHKTILEETGFGTADEMLYPDELRYVSDILSYVAVGARSTENQNHRLVASGLSCPVGMKNPTSGSLKVMVNSVHAAYLPHRFIYRNWQVESKGNPLAHAILRGYNTRDLAQSKANYHYEDLLDAIKLLEEDMTRPSLVIDCSHANARKDYHNQPRIAMEVIESMSKNEKIRAAVKGFMIESYLFPGNQPPDGGCKGVSYTDPCLGFAETAELLKSMDRAIGELYEKN